MNLRLLHSEKVIELRPEVVAFALLMEAKLKANDKKGTWKSCTLRYLSVRAGNELEELRAVLRRKKTRTITEVQGEAADVANFCMMIVDVLGGLTWP